MKNVSWVGTLYQKFESMCVEVEETVYQDTVKYMENQVQKIGTTVKKFYSDVLQDLSGDNSDEEFQSITDTEGTTLKSKVNAEDKTMDLKMGYLINDNEMNLADYLREKTPPHEAPSSSPPKNDPDSCTTGTCRISDTEVTCMQIDSELLGSEVKVNTEEPSDNVIDRTNGGDVEGNEDEEEDDDFRLVHCGTHGEQCVENIGNMVHPVDPDRSSLNGNDGVCAGEFDGRGSLDCLIPCWFCSGRSRGSVICREEMVRRCCCTSVSLPERARGSEADEVFSKDLFRCEGGGWRERKYYRIRRPLFKGGRKLESKKQREVLDRSSAHQDASDSDWEIV